MTAIEIILTILLTLAIAFVLLWASAWCLTYEYFRQLNKGKVNHHKGTLK